jgi:hypothetical protein
VAEELAKQEVSHKILYYEQCCLNKHIQSCPCYDDANIHWRGFSEAYFRTMKDIYVKSRTLKSYDKSVAEVKRMEPTKD